MKRAFALVLFLSVCGGLGAFSSSFARADGETDSSSHSLNRQTFLEMLKDPEMDSQGQDELLTMLQSYRQDQVNAGLTISQGPFVGYIIQNEVLPKWAKLYDSNYASDYQEYVTHVTYEQLFDLLMKAIASPSAASQLPDSLKSTADQVGSCLANKVEEASEDQGCKLDNSDAIPQKPCLLELGWMKYTCFIPFITSPCAARQALFADAKAQLIQAKKENVMAKVFPQIFPAMFRGSVLGGASKIEAKIGDFVSGKFKTTTDTDLWNAPLIDLQDSTGQHASLNEISTGLSADIRAASVFAQSHPEIAAPLLYAAANRLLVLMGGTEAKWDGQQFALSPDDHFNPSQDPKAAPKLLTNPFGGLGFVQTSSGIEQQAWDPNTSYSPPPIRLIPSLFALGADDVPSADSSMSENMVDLGQLMGSLADFLEMTSAKSDLASHFIDVDADPNASSKITDHSDPALFPRQGRQLAVLMIASIVQNMIAPNGHVIIPSGDPGTGPVDDHSGLFGVRYYNEVGLDGRIEGKVPTEALGNVFSAASRVSQLVDAKDPDIPAQFVALKSKIDQAVDVSMLSMIARSQQADGGFVDHLGDPAASERSLDTQVSAMSSLTTVYTQTLEPAQRLALRQAWTFFDHFWPKDSDFPISAVSADGTPAPDATQLSTVSAWGLLNLWTQTQASPLYEDLTNPADDQVWGKNGWDKWETRFDMLRKQLESQ